MMPPPNTTPGGPFIIHNDATGHIEVCPACIKTPPIPHCYQCHGNGYIVQQCGGGGALFPKMKPLKWAESVEVEAKMPDNTVYVCKVATKQIVANMRIRETGLVSILEPQDMQVLGVQ